MATCDQYEHFSRGDVVRIRDDARRAAPIHDQFPTTGTIQNITNAGFRGLEYDGATAEGERFWGISAADLELVEAVDPVAPWHGCAMSTPTRLQEAPMKTATPTATLLRATVTPRDKHPRSRWDTRPKTAKVRVFVTVTPEFPEPDGPLCRGSQKCGYYGPAACGEVDHKAWTNTYVRPGLAEQRALLAEAQGREKFEALGKLAFSVNAGCSVCPCSPGFIAEAEGTQDLFVTLEVAR